MAHEAQKFAGLDLEYYGTPRALLIKERGRSLDEMIARMATALAAQAV